MQVLGEAETIAPVLQPQTAPEIINNDDLYNDNSNTQPGLKVLALGMYPFGVALSPFIILKSPC
jgi:hypothetical protein